MTHDTTSKDSPSVLRTPETNTSEHTPQEICMDGSHLSPDHPMRKLKPGSSRAPCLTFMGSGNTGFRKPVPFNPVRKKAMMITREEAMAHRQRLKFSDNSE